MEIGAIDKECDLLNRRHYAQISSCTRKVAGPTAGGGVSAGKTLKAPMACRKSSADDRTGAAVLRPG
jgi:hypothetical protein